MLDGYYVSKNYKLSFDDENLGDRPFMPLVSPKNLSTGSIFEKGANESNAGYQKWEKIARKFFEVYKFYYDYLGTGENSPSEQISPNELLKKAKAAGKTNLDGSQISALIDSGIDPFGSPSSVAGNLNGSAPRLQRTNLFGVQQTAYNAPQTTAEGDIMGLHTSGQEIVRNTGKGIFDFVGSEIGFDGKYSRNENAILDIAPYMFSTDHNYYEETINGLVSENSKYDIFQNFNAVYSNYRLKNGQAAYDGMFTRGSSGNLTYGGVDMGIPADIFFDNFITPDISGVTYGDQNASRLLNFTMRILYSAAFVYSGFIDVLGKLNNGIPQGTSANDQIINSWSYNATKGEINKFHLAVLTYLTTFTHAFADFLRLMSADTTAPGDSAHGSVVLKNPDGSYVSLNAGIKNALQSRLKDYVDYIYNRQADLINTTMNNIGMGWMGGYYQGGPRAVLNEILTSSYSLQERIDRIQQIPGYQGLPYLRQLVNDLQALNSDANFTTAIRSIKSLENLAGEFNISSLNIYAVKKNDIPDWERQFVSGLFVDFNLDNLQFKEEITSAQIDAMVNVSENTKAILKTALGRYAQWSNYNGITDTDASKNTLNININPNRIASVIWDNYSGKYFSASNEPGSIAGTFKDQINQTNFAWARWLKTSEENTNIFLKQKFWNEFNVVGDWNKYTISNQNYGKAERRAAEKEENKRIYENLRMEGKRAQREAFNKELMMKQISRSNELKTMQSQSAAKHSAGRKQTAPAKKK